MPAVFKRKLKLRLSRALCILGWISRLTDEFKLAERLYVLSGCAL